MCQAICNPVSLTHFHTILTCLGKKPFSKHRGKRRKCWLPAFYPFPTMFSTLSKTYIIIYVTFILSSANVFNLDKVKFLSSGNGLNGLITIQLSIHRRMVPSKCLTNVPQQVSLPRCFLKTLPFVPSKV